MSATYEETVDHVVATALCVIDSAELGSAYPRLAECHLDVMAFVPTLDAVDMHFIGQYDAALIGCSPNELTQGAFRAKAAMVAKAVRTVAVVGSGSDPAIAAQLGFRGFVYRDIAPEALERTVDAVAHDEIAFPRGSLTALFRMLGFLAPPAAVSDNGGLTPRQQQIVDLIAQGATDREIATRLRISQSTAHKHVQNALRRSNARTRSQLVAVARLPIG